MQPHPEPIELWAYPTILFCVNTPSLESVDCQHSLSSMPIYQIKLGNMGLYPENQNMICQCSYDKLK